MHSGIFDLGQTKSREASGTMCINLKLVTDSKFTMSGSGTQQICQGHLFGAGCGLIRDSAYLPTYSVTQTQLLVLGKGHAESTMLEDATDRQSEGLRLN